MELDAVGEQPVVLGVAGELAVAIDAVGELATVFDVVLSRRTWRTTSRTFKS